MIFGGAMVDSALALLRRLVDANEQIALHLEEANEYRRKTSINTRHIALNTQGGAPEKPDDVAS